MSVVVEFRDRLRADRDLQSVQRTLEETFEPLGFQSLCYVVIRPPVGRQRPRVLGNYPKTWLNRYIDFDYANIDPTYPVAGASLFPVRWDEVYSDRRTSKKQKTFFDEAGECGLRNGVTVPIHGPAGGLASLSLATDMRPREFERVCKRFHDDLTLIAAYSHQAILEHAAREESFEPIRLTDRERQCLAWTARGKTSWEVGNILGITEGTVLFHLNNSMRKLHVFSKHHAVVKAIMLGLIAPEF